MKKYLKIIKNNILSMFSLWTLLLTFMIFIYLFSMKFNSIDSNIHSFDGFLKFIFSGPTNLTDNIVETFNWTLYQFFLLFIIGNFYFNELNVRSIYTIPRIGSKTYWNLCIQISSFLTCVVYFSFGSLICLICTSIFSHNFSFINIAETIKVIILLSLSSYFVQTLLFILIKFIKNHAASFLTILFTFYLSISLGDHFKIDKYIPLNQGILSKHIISNFTYNWSFFVLAFFILINLIFLNIILIKNDFDKLTHQ